jgi:hypothetical protein
MGASSIDACLCLENTYDRIKLGVVYGHPDNFNDSASQVVMAASTGEILLESQCVVCPRSDTFISCAPRNASERLGVVPLVQAGYAEFWGLPSGTDATNGHRHFFSCPFGKKACRSIRIDDESSNCEEGYRGTLCQQCTDVYAQTRRGCVPCEGSVESLLLTCGIVLFVSASVALVWRYVDCESERATPLVLAGAVTQRVWPRVSQGLNVFVGHYQVRMIRIYICIYIYTRLLLLTPLTNASQIVSLLPFLTGMDFPEPFASIRETIGDTTDGGIDVLPSIACSFGGSFTRRLVLKSLAPLLGVTVVGLAHRIRVWHLVNRKMTISSTVTPSKSWRVKLHRSMLRGRYRHTSAGWAFAVLYLLYPSTTATIFESFYCRALTEGGKRVLSADVSIVCFDENGALDPAYTPLLIAGIFLALVWGIGVSLCP